jgi:TniQ
MRSANRTVGGRALQRQVRATKTNVIVYDLDWNEDRRLAELARRRRRHQEPAAGAGGSDRRRHLGRDRAVQHAAGTDPYARWWSGKERLDLESFAGVDLVLPLVSMTQAAERRAGRTGIPRGPSLMRAGRLPVAPRPFRDETLSSWLGRVACRYGLDASALAACLAAPDVFDAPRPPIDDISPSVGQIALWAQVAAVDPARLRRMTLPERHPRRPLPWFLNQGLAATRPVMPRPSSPVCLGCFDTDWAVGHDMTAIVGRTGASRSAASARRMVGC